VVFGDASDGMKPNRYEDAAMTTHAKNVSADKTDVISLLMEDHKKVKKMFKDFENMKDSGSADELSELVENICSELTVHAEAEEAIFYPAVRAEIDDTDLVDEAEVEHGELKELVSHLQSMTADDPKYKATVKVLAEYVEHHVKEEEGEIFPRVKKAKMDIDALGEEVANFKKSSGMGGQPTPTARTGGRAGASGSSRKH
jgi:hemerythrin superfamily protein